MISIKDKWLSRLRRTAAFGRKRTDDGGLLYTISVFGPSWDPHFANPFYSNPNHLFALVKLRNALRFYAVFCDVNCWKLQK